MTGERKNGNLCTDMLPRIEKTTPSLDCVKSGNPIGNDDGRCGRGGLGAFGSTGISGVIPCGGRGLCIGGVGLWGWGVCGGRGLDGVCELLCDLLVWRG